MWLIGLEALIALSLFLFIMWWTLAPVKRREDQQERARLQAASKIDPPL